MGMTLREFREKLKGSRIKPDTELMIHVEDGDFPVSVLEYSRIDGKLKICTDEWSRKNRYRIIYTILKDHSEIVETSEYNMTAATDEEVTFDIEALRDRILEYRGIKGEKNEKSGSIAMEIQDWDYVAEKKGVVVRKPVKKTHYFSCVVSEILKVVDEENDVYMRVWYDGNPR